MISSWLGPPVNWFLDLINLTRCLLTLNWFFQKKITSLHMFSPKSVQVCASQNAGDSLKNPYPLLILTLSPFTSEPKSTTSIWLFIAKLNLSLTKYLNLHWYYLYRNYGFTVKIIGWQMPCVVSRSEFVKT